MPTLNAKGNEFFLLRNFILENKLEEIDTSGVEPLIYIHEEVNVLRSDKAEGMLNSEDGLKNAPKRIDNYFAVPKIINK